MILLLKSPTNPRYKSNIDKVLDTTVLSKVIFEFRSTTEHARSSKQYTNCSPPMKKIYLKSICNARHEGTYSFRSLFHSSLNIFEKIPFGLFTRHPRYVLMFEKISNKSNIRFANGITISTRKNM